MRVIFFGFLLVALNSIVGHQIYDVATMPRLLALLVFLGIALPLMASRRMTVSFDFSVLRDPLLNCFGVYWLVTVVSLCFAVNPTAGLNDVFRTYGAFLVLSMSCLLLGARPGWPALLAKTVVIAAGVAVGGGFFQMIAHCGLRLPTRAEAETVTGWMGNVNIFAGMLNLLLPFCLCGVVILRRWWRAASAGATVAMIGLIILLQSRGAYISLALSGILVLGLLWANRKRFGISPRLLLGGLLAPVLLGSAIALLALTSENPVAQRVRGLGSNDFSAIDGGRVMVWGMTLKMIGNHPLTGVGAGNFPLRIDEYFADPGLDHSKLVIQWLQPHNDFLGVFAEKGILGILAFVGLFGLAFAHGVGVLRATGDREQRWISLFALMGLTAYMGASCFDFPIEGINQQVYLAVYFSILIAARHSARGPLAPVPAPRAIRLAALVAMAGVGLGVVYAFHVFEQEKCVWRARRDIGEEKFGSALEWVRRADTSWKTLDPLATPVAFLEGYCLQGLGDSHQALICFERARRQHPNASYILLTLGAAYQQAGDNDKALECLALAGRLRPYDTDIIDQLLEAKQRAKKPETLSESDLFPEH